MYVKILRYFIGKRNENIEKRKEKRGKRKYVFPS